MKALYIAEKNLKDTFRNLKSSGIIFILPIVFMGVFAFAFGRSFRDVQFEIAILESKNEQFVSKVNTLEQIEKEPSEIEKNKSGEEKIKLFKITRFSDKEEALESIKSSKNLLLITDDPQYTMIYDPSNNFAVAAAGVISDILNPREENFKIEQITSSELTGFQLLAPGLIVYGVLILIPHVAHNLASLSEKKLIFRYFTSNVKAKDIIGGYLISQSVLSLIQTAILIGVAALFGVRSEGGILLIFIAMLLVNLFTIGVGLLIGSFVERTDAAENIGSIFSIILGFFSGSFISNVNEITFSIGGKEIGFSQIFPSSHATEAMKGVMLYGNSFEQVASNLLYLLVSSLLLLILGIVVFYYRKLQRVNL